MVNWSAKRRQKSSWPTINRSPKPVATQESSHRLSIALKFPVLALVLGATAVPIELRLPPNTVFSTTVYLSDAVANIAGYVPVGGVLAAFGLAPAVLSAAVLAVIAEASQLFMIHRDPSAVDIVCNILGASLGAVGVFSWRVDATRLSVTTGRAIAAAISAALLLIVPAANAPAVPNERGSSAPGTLEAHWTLDEGKGDIVHDASGHNLQGWLHGGARHVPGRLGGAVALQGPRDYIEIDPSPSLRLKGSMTVAAWIRPSSFPADDAAIVSSHSGVGYQLDTTVDLGPRTVGFKLGDACGSLMARYGRTRLIADAWYHVAGVYDAQARRLDVFVNGRRDNGALRGSVSASQKPSRQRVYIGRRSDSRRFAFAGVIDDVRIYSRALSEDEIAAVMASAADPPFARETGPSPEQPIAKASNRDPSRGRMCAIADREDAALPGFAAAIGALVAFACIGLCGSAAGACTVLLSGGAGLFLIGTAGATVPELGRWLVPLTSLAAAVIVMRARQRVGDGSNRAAGF